MHRDDAAVDTLADGAREIDRRTIAKGVAWTVPVVIVATAAPAAAASPVTTTTFVSAMGKYNGNSSTATFTLFFSGSSASKVTITGVSSPGETWMAWPSTAQSLVPSGTQLQLTFGANRPVKVNTAVTVTLTFKIDNGPEQQATVNLPAGGK